MDQVQCKAAQVLVSEGLPADTLLRLRVVGRSMVPCLLPGDHLSVVPMDGRELRCGDVAVVRRSDGFVTHRFICLRADGYCMKGDHQPYLDQPVAATEIVGVVRLVERDGFVYDFSTKPSARQNRFLGWLGLMETRLRLGRLMMPVSGLIKQIAASLVKPRAIGS